MLGRLGVPATSYVDWAASHSLGAAVAAEDDPDGDGVPNLLEYALSGAPDDPASAPRLSFDGATFEFPFDPARPGAELTLQRSEDLATWQPVAVIRPSGLPSVADEGHSLQLPSESGTARVTLPAEAPPPKVFFRLSAEATR